MWGQWSGFKFPGLGFQVLGFRVLDLGFRFRVQGLGSRLVQYVHKEGSRFRV